MIPPEADQPFPVSFVPRNSDGWRCGTEEDLAFSVYGFENAGPDAEDPSDLDMAFDDLAAY